MYPKATGIPLVGLAGAVLGVVLGVLATGLITRGYTGALGTPDTIVAQHPSLAILGLAFGADVGLAGAAAPAITAARTVPAEAMRNTVSARPPGVKLRRVAATLATENLLATALGVPIGLILGVLAARAVLDSFASDLFHFPLHLTWWALPAAAGVLLAAALSQWPATRAVRRMNIARVVRERAT